MKPNLNSTYVAVKTKFIIDGQASYRWLTKPVVDLIGGKNEIRCAICEGPVRIHTQRVAHGPQPHVEHLRSEDSELCPNGFLRRQK